MGVRIKKFPVKIETERTLATQPAPEHRRRADLKPVNVTIQADLQLPAILAVLDVPDLFIRLRHVVAPEDRDVTTGISCRYHWIAMRFAKNGKYESLIPS